MFLAFAVLAGVSNWIPMRWNSGDPRSLDLLKDTPVNCVLLERSDWDPRFVKIAASRGIATIAVVHSGPDLADQAKHAARMKMNAVALAGEYDSEEGDRLRAALVDTSAIPIELPIRRHVRIDSHDPVVGTSQALWPGVEVEHGGRTVTGPSSNPWINTNSGFLRFVRSTTNAAIWVDVRPPPKLAVTVDQYCVAIADSAMTGAHWIVSLDDDLDRRLLTGDAQAAAGWKRIAAYLRYFETYPEWRDYRPFSEMAVVEDTDSGGLLSSSLLDMLSVLHTSVRPVPTRRLSAESLHGARIVLNVDAETISEQQKQALQDFAASGGVIVNPPPGWRFPQVSERQMAPTRRQMDQIGGMWEVTYTATARKNFGVRTFNTSTMLFNLMAARDHKSLLIHLVNYTDFAAETITVQALGTWKRARLYRPDGATIELSVYPANDGTGVDIERIAVAGTLRID